MESNRLSAFYQSVTSWPGNDTELLAVTEKICNLMNVPFTATYRTEGASKAAFRFISPDATINRDVIDDCIRRMVTQAEGQFSATGGSFPQIHQLAVVSEELPWLNNVGVHFLTAVNVSGENRPTLTGNRGARSRHDFAWLIIGSLQPLSTFDQTLLLAAAQRISSLAELSIFESGVQLRNQFLSIASHELKTPLTSIYGILQLQERMIRLKKDEPLQVTQERQESYLKMVIRQVRRLNELIDGLLDVSRIQNGRFMVEPSETDIALIVRDTIASRLAVIALEAGVKINVDAPERLLAWVDPVRIEEVVSNLAMNAIRFSPEGGVIWVRLRDDNGSLRLTVRDQGPSVPLEDRERIFQPFERAQRTSRFGGLGLGLFISRQIAQLHGGNVSLVESLPGKGNVFEASFPSRSENLIHVSA